MSEITASTPIPRTDMPLVPAEQPTVRDWALAHGYTVKSTGRLPNAVIEAYKTFHPETTA